MKRSICSVLAAALGFSWGALHAACVDTTPVTVFEDASVWDVSHEGDGMTPCMQCVTGSGDAGGGCGAEWQACLANATCSMAILCAQQTGCFDSIAGVGFIQCALPCAQDAGMVDPSNPAFGLGFTFFDCFASKCQAACGGG